MQKLYKELTQTIVPRTKAKANLKLYHKLIDHNFVAQKQQMMTSTAIESGLQVE